MNTESNIPDLLRTLRDDTSTLVREEIALARTELSEKAVVLGRNVGYLAVGAMLGSSALLLALIGISYWIGEMIANRGVNPGIAALLGFLIVAAVTGLVSGFLVAKASKALSNDSITPDRTARSLREDKQWAQNKIL